MGKSSLDYFGIWMTVIGTLLSVIGTLVTLNMWNTNRGMFFLVFFLVVFGLCMMYFLYKWVKYKRYYNAYPVINRAFSQAKGIVNPDIKDSQNLRDDLTTLQNFCSDIAEAFGTISNTQCAVCIKIIVGNANNERAWLETLVRDYNSSRKRLNRENESKKHWLEKK
jgi:Na+/melibiose symporter-like transporter